MPANELRKDYILDRWVVIASQRRRRPSDFVAGVRMHVGGGLCPFCPGNEHLTPPATLLYVFEDGELKKARDEDGNRRRDWIVRCIPNLYPAFMPPESGAAQSPRIEHHYVSMDALGYHEVLVESPNHDEHPGVARISQLTLVINALRDRYSFFMGKDYVRYVSIFRNHGASAGASLSHAHSQIIATPIIPSILGEEMAASEKYYEERGRCIFCEIIDMEARSERFIWENDRFIVFAPWAPTNPFEFWIFPKRHQSTILELTEDEIRRLAEALKVSLGGLRSLLNDPPYNYGFHMVPEKYYHWHVEVYPKLAIWAGFEKSTGIYINTMPPEEAARSLREAFKKEEELI
ncbi:MAG: DUF4921 family protein [Candidatus Bathyarchaeia archaeon]|nr:DUF4921 family protein [Candidatus Bathyarchaeota archaeon]